MAEATSRVKDLNDFVDGLEKLGFDVFHTRKKGDFTFIKMIKSDKIFLEIELQF